MNSTKWETLTDFTKWLGREGNSVVLVLVPSTRTCCSLPPCLSPAGLCKVDETPKGWYVQYIDRDPETIRRQEEEARKKKHELDDVERTARFIQEQVRRGQEAKEAEVSSDRAGSGSRTKAVAVTLPSSVPCRASPSTQNSSVRKKRR